MSAFMPKTKPQKKPNSHPLPKQMEKLLVAQTSVILNAVDERFAKQDQKMEARFAAQHKRIEERFVAQNIAILTAVDTRLAKLQQRFMDKLSNLTNTLDKFLKRLTDTEQEFTFMKHDVKRIKAVLREKLGVVLD